MMHNIKHNSKPVLTLGTSLPDYTAAHTAIGTSSISSTMLILCVSKTQCCGGAHCFVFPFLQQINLPYLLLVTPCVNVSRV
jgi:hypothetical protein